ncbi:hypothetical protein JCM1393_26830 [Clostridium carnis]
MKTVIIEGMSCGHCVRHVKEALSELVDTKVIEVSLENKSAIIETMATDKQIQEVIEEAGYEVSSIN